MAVTTSFIVDTDLQVYMPDVLSFGVASFDPQSLLATDDVVARIEAEWWPEAVSRRFGLFRENSDYMFSMLPTMNVALLDSVSLVPLTVYRALSHYAMPMLSSDADADGDLFSRRASRYDTFYKEEWEKVVRLPIYDFSQDGNFTSFEKKGPPVKRLLRA